MFFILVVSKFTYLVVFIIILPSVNCERLNFEKLYQNDFDDVSYMGDKPVNAVPRSMEIRKIVKELLDSKKGNKLLIKRIVSHSKPFKMEYDDNFKLLYKPLIRLHKSKLNTDSVENKFYLTKISPSLKSKKILLKISKMSPTGLDDDKMDIKEMAEKLNKRNKIVKFHNTLVDFIKNVLRSSQFEKSGEDNDPLAPGKKIAMNEFVMKSEKPKLWVPHYSPWNFWTYKKTIYQDVCPGNQVKIGNMCVWTPPH